MKTHSDGNPADEQRELRYQKSVLVIIIFDELFNVPDSRDLCVL